MAGVVRCEILGPLAVTVDGRGIHLAGPNQRAFLAVLLLAGGRVISFERLIDELWDEPPPTARTILHGHASKLRKALGASGSLLETVAAGYRLALPPGSTDLEACEEALSRGRAAFEVGQLDQARVSLRHARDLWRGDPLSDLAQAGFLLADVQRLRELRGSVEVLLMRAELDAGHHEEIVGELAMLADRDPLDEGVRALLVTALYRCGRQSDALEVLRDTRALLADQLGVDPGLTLRELERAVLRQDPRLELAPARARARSEVVEERTQEQDMRRSLVTCVWVSLRGVPGHRELDEEARRHALIRARAEVEGTMLDAGGLLAPTTGPEVVAAFGARPPRTDEVLHAVFSAFATHRAIGSNRQSSGDVEAAIGIATGETLVEPGGDWVAASDPAVSARQLAGEIQPGDTAIDQATRGLLGGVVPVDVEGGVMLVREPERSTSLDAAETPSPFVGRRRELAELRASFEATRDDRRPELVTIIGPAGIGKSRLVTSFIEAIGDTATVVAGACPRIGTDPASWPLVGSLLDAASPPGNPEERARRCLREIARRSRAGPVVLAIEDLQWADDGLLDLLTALVSRAEGPVLTLATARPEFLDRRSRWGDDPAAHLLRLGPLQPRQSEELFRSLAGAARDDVRSVAAISGGNPLFIQELAARVPVRPGLDAGARELAEISPTVYSLMSARLARLDRRERSVAERASVIGEYFAEEHLRLVLPESWLPELSSIFRHLVRAGVLAPVDRAEPTARRFHHVVVRDVVYRQMTKRDRARIHDSLAAALEGARGDPRVVGLHSASAATLWRELGDLRASSRAADRAVPRLITAADSASFWGDPATEAQLAEVALRSLPRGDPTRIDLAARIGRALVEVGGLDHADAVLSEAIEETRDDDVGRARLDVLLARVRMFHPTADDASDPFDVMMRARPILEAAQDRQALIECWNLAAQIYYGRGQFDLADDAQRRLLGYMKPAGTEGQLEPVLPTSAPDGPSPIDDHLVDGAVARLSRLRGMAFAEHTTVVAHVQALRGRPEEALATLEAGRVAARELALRLTAATIDMEEGITHLSVGNAGDGERVLRAATDELAALGERFVASTAGAYLARAITMAGRSEEALAMSLRIERGALRDDYMTHFICRMNRSICLAALGSLEDALILARGTIEAVDRSGFVVLQGDARMTLAEVLARAGDTGGALAVGEEALKRYRSKGDLASERLALTRLEALRPPGDQDRDLRPGTPG